MNNTRKDKQGNYLRKGESQRADGHYVYRYTQNGIRHTVYCKDFIDLKNKRKEIEKDLNNDIEYTTITLNKLYTEFMENIKSQNISPQTSLLYSTTWNRHVYNTIGKRKVKDIKKAEIIAYYSRLQKSNGLSKQTIKTTHTILRATFEYALNSGLILNNPCDNVMCYLKEDRKQEKRALSDREQTIMADFLKNLPKHNYKTLSNIFILGCNTGMRIGELLCLTWKDIDLKNETITVNKSISDHARKDKQRKIGTTKTSKSNRVIPMLNEVKQALHRQRVLQFANGKNDYELDGYSDFIFINQKGTLFRSTDINAMFKNACRMYNAYEKNRSSEENREPEYIECFTSHCMRHTFATKLVNKSVDYKAIQSLMGHADIKTTLNIYTHDSLEQNKEEIKKLEPERVAL